MDDKLQRLEGRYGKEGYYFYFKILELCASQYDGISKNPVFFFNWFTLQNQTRMKRKQIQNQLITGSELNLWKSTQTDNEVSIELPKLLEIMDRDYKYARKQRGSDAQKTTLEEKKNKIEIKNKKKNTTNVVFSGTQKSVRKLGPISEFSNDAEVNKFLTCISQSVQISWMKLYESPEFIQREILKAIEWLSINPNRKPKSSKGYATFMSRWLSRSWESFRIKQPTNNINKQQSFSEKRINKHRDMARKVMKGEL